MELGTPAYLNHLSNGRFHNRSIHLSSFSSHSPGIHCLLSLLPLLHYFQCIHSKVLVLTSSTTYKELPLPSWKRAFNTHSSKQHFSSTEISYSFKKLHLSVLPLALFFGRHMLALLKHHSYAREINFQAMKKLLGTFLRSKQFIAIITLLQKRREVSQIMRGLFNPLKHFDYNMEQ